MRREQAGRGHKDGDGFAGYCIPCMKAKAVEWQKANPEKKAASDKKQSQKPARKAQAREYEKRWRALHPEKGAEYTKRYCQRHPELTKARQAAYRKTAAFKESQRRYHQKDAYKNYHRERERLRRATLSWQIYDNKRRVIREYQIEGAFSLDEWLAVLEAFQHSCAYCGTSDTKLAIEHLTPLCRDGKHEVGNIAPACKPCNSQKRHRTLQEFAEVRGLDVSLILEKALLQ